MIVEQANPPAVGHELNASGRLANENGSYVKLGIYIGLVLLVEVDHPSDGGALGDLADASVQTSGDGQGLGTPGVP